MGFFTVNPATGEKLGGYQFQNFDFVSENLKRANEAYHLWKDVSLNEKIELMQKLANVLEENQERYALIISKEMGKVVKESRAEVLKCVSLINVYCKNINKWLRSENIQADGKKHFVKYESLGVILSIMPWNFPFWQVLRFAIPTMLTGNVSVLKHSNKVPECALAIEKAFLLAGFPRGVFQVVISGNDIVDKMISSHIIKGVSFTGSTEIGSLIAEIAGANLKKTVLELGGSDPFVVLEDADIDKAVEGAYLSRFMNAGQSCIAAKRFIIAQNVVQEFTDKLVNLINSKVVDNPLDETTDIGPLVDIEALNRIKIFVDDAIRFGAHIETGGKVKGGKGCFYLPTVLTNVTPRMKVLTEEVFGPVAPIISFKKVDEGVTLANRTSFGLGASVWSSNLNQARKIAEKLECGVCFINSIVKSDPLVPFGGVKKSGIGRELSHYGLKEFVNIKSYNIYD